MKKLKGMRQIHHQSSPFLSLYSFVVLLMDAYGIFPDHICLVIQGSFTSSRGTGLGIIQMDDSHKSCGHVSNESKWINFSKSWHFLDVIFWNSSWREKNTRGFLSIRLWTFFFGSVGVTVTSRHMEEKSAVIVIHSAQVKFLALLAGILNALSGLQPSLLGSCLEKESSSFRWEQGK